MAPAASLSDLPRNIKERIVELCHADNPPTAARKGTSYEGRDDSEYGGDCGYGDGYDDYGDEDDYGDAAGGEDDYARDDGYTPRYDFHDESESGSRDGDEDSTIAALFEVSKEWRSIAAPYRFRTLTGSQCLSPLFNSVIKRKYGHFVKELQCNDVGSVDANTFLDSLADFIPDLDYFAIPELSRLYCGIFDEKFAKFETRLAQGESGAIPAPSLDAARERVDEIIGPIIRRSKTVSMPAGQCQVAFPQCFGSVIEYIVVTEQEGAVNNFDTLIDMISKCPSLLKFEIDLLPEAWYNSEEGLARYGNVWPAIGLLSFATADSTLHAQVLITTLSQTLKLLEIEVNDRTHKHHPFGPGVAFPCLNVADIRGDETGSSQLVSSMTPALFPSLLAIAWRPHPECVSRERPDRAETLTNLRRGLANFASSPTRILMDCHLPRGWRMMDAEFEEALDAPESVNLALWEGSKL